MSATPLESGIECVRWMRSILNGPASTMSPIGSTSSAHVAQLVLVELGARHRDRQLAAVDDRDLVLAEVADHPRQRAEVVLVAVRDDDRLDRVDVARAGSVKSGRTRSMPIISAVGKRRPQSTTTIRSVVLDDRHVLADLADASEREDAEFAAHRGGDPRQQPVAGEHVVDVRALGLVALDERQAQRPGVMAEHLQRGLDGRGAGGDEHRRVDLLQRRVDLRARVRLVVHPAHLVADDVRGDADAAGAADVQAAARRCRRCRRGSARPSISCSSSELACLTASMPSIWASSASRSGGMLVAVRPGML